MKTINNKIRIYLKTVIILLAILPQLVMAQSDHKSLDLNVRWSPGDTFSFKITDIVEEWKGNDLVQDDTNFYYADLIILDSSDFGYRVGWKYINDLSAYGIPQETWHEFNGFIDQEIICITDTKGAFVALENVEELRSEQFDVFEASLQYKLKAKKIDQEGYRKTLNMLKDLYAGQNGANLLLEDFINAVHSKLGNAYPIQQRVRSKEWRDNPFGGDPIPLQTELTLENPGQNVSPVRLVKNSQIKDDAVEGIILAFLKRMDVEETEMKEMLEGAQFRMNYKTIYDFDSDLTVASKVVSTDEFTLETADFSSEKFETQHIELLDFKAN